MNRLKKYVSKIIIFLLVTVSFLILTLMAFINLSPQFGASPSGLHLKKISKSPNYDDNHFINLIPTNMEMNFRNGMGVMYKWLFNSQGRKPPKPLPVMFDKNGQQLPPNPHSRITWYGHSAIMLEMDRLTLFLDPMLGSASSPVSFMSKRFMYEKPIEINSIPKLDAVILSHDHYDHLDYTTIMKLKERVTHFYTPLGVGSHLKRWGIDESKITELDWWDSVEIGELELIAAPARHFSGRGLNDRNKTQWASWIIIGSNERLYFSGDSGYGPHFKKIGEKFGPFDFAMMECGQYNELWEAIHMMPEQTIQASLDLGAKQMMPIHWSAFNLSLHSWTEPVVRASKAAKKHNVKLITPVIGERFSPVFSKAGNFWWSEL